MTIYAITAPDVNTGSGAVVWGKVETGAVPIDLDLDLKSTPHVRGFSIFDDRLLLVSACEQVTSVGGVPLAGKVYVYNGSDAFEQTFVDADGNTIYNAAIEDYVDLGAAGRYVAVTGSPEPHSDDWRSWYGLFEISISSTGTVHAVPPKGFPRTPKPVSLYVVEFNGNIYFSTQRDLFKVVRTGDGWSVQPLDILKHVFAMLENPTLALCTSATGKLQVIAEATGHISADTACKIATLATEGNWTVADLPNGFAPHEIFQTNGKYYLNAAGNTLLSSSDGENWQPVPLPEVFSKFISEKLSGTEFDLCYGCVYALAGDDIYLAVNASPAAFWKERGLLVGRQSGLFRYEPQLGEWQGDLIQGPMDFRFQPCGGKLFAISDANAFSVDENVPANWSTVIANSPSGISQLLHVAAG